MNPKHPKAHTLNTQTEAAEPLINEPRCVSLIFITSCRYNLNNMASNAYKGLKWLI